uniref:YjeF N-terminal domain-containing protein n=1 Tax=Monopterus albus TaxID=43700 RepID=A0A3Q3JMD5_MONAL
MTTDWLNSVVVINCRLTLGVYQGEVFGVKCPVPEVTFKPVHSREQTRMDRIRNEHIRGTAQVFCFGDKVREARLRWFGHVQRRDSGYIGRRMLEMELPGKRSRGRPKWRYMDYILLTCYLSSCFPSVNSGLIVPSIPCELHKHLLASVELWGLSPECRLETIGVCFSQMVLTLPTVVLLCGPHVQGARGISCGRHLAHCEVEIILFVPSFVKMQEVVTIKVKQAISVDLFINYLHCHEDPLLREQSCIDPPWTLFLSLPLPLANTESRIYLCDIDVPKMVFHKVGKNSHSHFGCKFVILLHPA